MIHNSNDKLVFSFGRGGEGKPNLDCLNQKLTASRIDSITAGSILDERNIDGVNIRCYALNNNPPYQFSVLMEQRDFTIIEILFQEWSDYQYFLQNPGSILDYLR